MEHIKDEVIQKVLFENAEFSDAEKSHIQSCSSCQYRMHDYEMFFRPENFAEAKNDENIVQDEEILKDIMDNIYLFESTRQINKRHIRRTAAIIIGLFIAAGLTNFTFFRNSLSDSAHDKLLGTLIITLTMTAGIALHLTDIMNSCIIKKKTLLS